MTAIIKASPNDSALLAELARVTLIESHGHSASPEDMAVYISEKYTNEALREELIDPQNIYHIIYHNDEVAGFSKIILNCPYEGSPAQHITKMERLYLLQKFYGSGLG